MTKDDLHLDPAIRGWIVNTAHKNYWRIASWYEFEDLIQDGYFCLCKCREKFKYPMVDPDGHENTKEFMAFFQRAFENLIIDLANKHSQTPETAMAGLSDNQVEGIETWSKQASALSDASLATLIANAPAEIAEMLKQILIDGLADVPYLKTRLRKKELPGGKLPRIVKGKRRILETTVEHYDRCLAKPGVISKLRGYFLEDQESDPLIDRLVQSLFQAGSEVCVDKSNVE